MKDWLNAPFDAYTRYTHDVDPRALKLIEKYGWFFDDKWFYWQPKRNKNIIKKLPIWCWPQKKVNTEKWQKMDFNAKLERFLIVDGER